jgi:hypothetical protein
LKIDTRCVGWTVLNDFEGSLPAAMSTLPNLEYLYIQETRIRADLNNGGFCTRDVPITAIIADCADTVDPEVICSCCDCGYI